MNARYAGLVPIAILLAVLLALVVSFYPEPDLPRTPIFVLPYPFSSAHSLFLSAAALMVAYFFARGFISNGSFSLIALGNGSIVLGLGFLLSQILGNPPYGGPNELTGISSIVFLASGIFFGAFASLSVIGKTVKLGRPHTTLFVSYIGGAAIVGLSIILVETGSVPPLFVKGVGPTLLREEFLGAAIVLYSYSSVTLMRDFAKSHTPILYWFSLGLGAIAVGFLSAYLGRFPGGPFSWLGRFSVSVGGVYMLIAILEAYRGAEPNPTGPAKEQA